MQWIQQYAAMIYSNLPLNPQSSFPFSQLLNPSATATPTSMAAMAGRGSKFLLSWKPRQSQTSKQQSRRSSEICRWKLKHQKSSKIIKCKMHFHESLSIHDCRLRFHIKSPGSIFGMVAGSFEDWCHVLYDAAAVWCRRLMRHRHEYPWNKRTWCIAGSYSQSNMYLIVWYHL